MGSVYVQKHILLCVFVVTGAISLSRAHIGFGFVTFESEEDVTKLCDLQFSTINQKTVGVAAVMAWSV